MTTLIVNPASKQVSSVTGSPANSYVYPQTVTLVSGVPTLLDYTGASATGQLGVIRGVKIDNTANLYGVTLTAANGADVLYCPPYSFVQSPLAVPPDQPQLTLVGVGSVTVYAYNYQVPYGQGTAQANTVPNNNGVVQVSDSLLESTVTGNALRSLSSLLGNGDVVVPERAADAVYSGTLTAASTVTVIAGSPSFFCKSMDLQLQPTSTLATAGVVTLTVKCLTSGTVIATRHVYVPSTSANVPASVLSLSGLNFVGAYTGDSLAITLSTAFTSGGIDYTVFGGLTGTAG